MNSTDLGSSPRSDCLVDIAYTMEFVAYPLQMLNLFLVKHESDYTRQVFFSFNFFCWDLAVPMGSPKTPQFGKNKPSEFNSV